MYPINSIPHGCTCFSSMIPRECHFAQRILEVIDLGGRTGKGEVEPVEQARLSMTRVKEPDDTIE